MLQCKENEMGMARLPKSPWWWLPMPPLIGRIGPWAYP